MTDDRELEEIKRKRLMDLQNQAAANQAMQDREEVQKRTADKERQDVVKRFVTPEAYERLTNVKLVRPDVVENVENQVIMLAQSGRLNRLITDAEVKSLLARLSEKRETKIERR
ncbi:MAG: DNA-binding protein [Candidatus Thermoplasmatota archaeon]|nr:DNA-binding protein [Candidatus Thermoplasmatota archaeon]MCL6002585.1 DNA-binding protein [Candidatus Thermoplasmatota archaeon]